MIGAAGKALHHEVQQPGQADAHRTANPAQGDTLAQQVFNIRPLLGRNEEVLGISAKLTLASLAEMILFAMSGMAVFLVPS